MPSTAIYSSLCFCFVFSSKGNFDVWEKKIPMWFPVFFSQFNPFVDEGKFGIDAEYLHFYPTGWQIKVNSTIYSQLAKVLWAAVGLILGSVWQKLWYSESLFLKIHGQMIQTNTWEERESYRVTIIHIFKITIKILKFLWLLWCVHWNVWKSNMAYFFKFYHKSGERGGKFQFYKNF